MMECVSVLNMCVYNECSDHVVYITNTINVNWLFAVCLLITN